MTDIAVLRRSPLVDLDLGSTSGRVALADPGPATALLLRGSDKVAKQAGLALGLPLPQEPCRAAVRGPRAALWLGPDEWLLTAPPEQEAEITAKLAQALSGEPHSLVDVSHRNHGLDVTGPGAAAVLNAGCPLDLDLAACPVGMCTRTLFGKAEIVLWRTAEDGFRMIVWRSFLAYVHGVLAQAIRDEQALRPERRPGGGDGAGIPRPGFTPEGGRYPG